MVSQRDDIRARTENIIRLTRGDAGAARILSVDNCQIRTGLFLYLSQQPVDCIQSRLRDNVPNDKNFHTLFLPYRQTIKGKTGGTANAAPPYVRFSFYSKSGETEVSS